LPQVSFLMYGQSMYRPFMELLFARLSPSLYDQALRRVARFLTTNTVVGAVSELGVLVAAVVWAHPAKATQGLLRPLHALLLAEADAVLHTLQVRTRASGRLPIEAPQHIARVPVLNPPS